MSRHRARNAWCFSPKRLRTVRSLTIRLNRFIFNFPRRFFRATTRARPTHQSRSDQPRSSRGGTAACKVVVDSRSASPSSSTARRFQHGLVTMRPMESYGALFTMAASEHTSMRETPSQIVKRRHGCLRRLGGVSAARRRLHPRHPVVHLPSPSATASSFST